MTHIDEGTIHAWLDSALPPDEAARVEAHVRGCEQCSAAVAEARGFIAASSRILSALDDVPGGVIPQERAGASPATASVPGRSDAPVGSSATSGGVAPAPLRGRRAWWQRPRFAAAAGIAFIAVALSVVARRGGLKSVADYSMERAPATESPSVAAPPQSPAVAPAPTQAPTAASAAPAEQKVAAARAKAPASREESADATSRGRGAVENRAAPPPAARESTVADVAARGVAPTAQGAVAGGTARPADSTAAKRTLAVSPDSITRTEKARVLGERTLQLEAVVTTGAAEARIDARPGVTTVLGIVGCYRLQRRVPALDAGVTEIIALEGTETGTFEGEVLRSARLIGARPEANTQWHWTLSPKGDVALVRAQAGAYARFPLALRMAAQTGETSVATRITCPAR